MHADRADDAAELNADEAAPLKEMPGLSGVGQTHRVFMGQTIAGSLGGFATDLLAQEAALAQLAPAPGAVSAPPAALNRSGASILRGRTTS